MKPITIECETLLSATQVQEAARQHNLQVMSIQEVTGESCNIQIRGTHDQLECFYQANRESFIVVEETFEEWLAYSESITDLEDFSNILNRMCNFAITQKNKSQEKQKWEQIHRLLNQISQSSSVIS